MFYPLQQDTLNNTFQSFWQQAEWLKCDSIVKNANGEVLSTVNKSASIEDVLTRLDSISAYGIGFSDIISVISLPLIIMLFAFAFPFIFQSINHINSKYESKWLSNLFEDNSIHAFFWYTTYISLGYVFVLGATNLLLPSEDLEVFSKIASWSSLFVALLYSITVVLFVRYCVKFNKAESLIHFIDKAYKRDIKKRPSIWWRLRQKVKVWRHRKDKDWITVYKQAVRFSGGWSEGSAEQVYNLRLIALCKYALREHDVNLFYSVLESVDKIQEKEKKSINNSFGTRDNELEEGAPHYLTSNFFNDVFESYATCQKDKRVEESLIWRFLSCYNKSMFVGIADITFITRTLLRLCDTNQALLLEKYIDRAGYYFSFIPELPRKHYVKGYAPNKRDNAEKKSRENWDDICNYHFLVLSYAFSKRLFGLQNVLQSLHSYRDHNLFPVSASDILIRYARCRSELRDSDYFGHFKVEEIYGKKVNVGENIDNYAMMLLLLLSDKEDRQTEWATPDDLNVIKEQKQTLIAKAKQLQEDTGWSLTPDRIKRVNIEELFGNALTQISQSINPQYESESNEAQPFGQLFLDIIQTVFPFECTRHYSRSNRKDKEKNWYNEPITQGQKEQFENEFKNVEHTIERQIPHQYLGDESQTKTKSIDINECVLVIDKLYFMNADLEMSRYLYHEFMEVINNRIVYTLLSAYQNMKIEEVSLTPADFGHFIDGFTKNDADNYLLFDVDSHMDSWLILTYGAGFRSSYKGIPFFSVENAGRFSYLADLPAYEFFKDSILLIKKKCQPTLKNKTEDGRIVFNYKDESSEEKKILSLRVGVGLNKELVYNPEDTIIRIRTKKMVI